MSEEEVNPTKKVQLNQNTESLGSRSQVVKILSPYQIELQNRLRQRHDSSIGTEHTLSKEVRITEWIELNDLVENQIEEYQNALNMTDTDLLTSTDILLTESARKWLLKEPHVLSKTVSALCILWNERTLRLLFQWMINENRRIDLFLDNRNPQNPVFPTSIEDMKRNFIRSFESVHVELPFGTVLRTDDNGKVGLWRVKTEANGLPMDMYEGAVDFPDPPENGVEVNLDHLLIKSLHWQVFNQLLLYFTRCASLTLHEFFDHLHGAKIQPLGRLFHLKKVGQKIQSSPVGVKVAASLMPYGADGTLLAFI